MENNSFVRSLFDVVSAHADTLVLPIEVTNMQWPCREQKNVTVCAKNKIESVAAKCRARRRATQRVT
jgi:hypothetical protein